MRSRYGNEPARFGIPAGWIAPFLAGKGFEILEHLSADEMSRNYLPQDGPQEIGKVPLMFSLVHARVK
jgi:hypothetical protein